jgi:hypothetical protein
MVDRKAWIPHDGATLIAPPGHVAGDGTVLVFPAARTLVETLAVFIGCASAFFIMLHALGPAVADVDSLYHYQVATLMRERLSWVDISWLPFTVLGEHGPDHHMLFHALVAPLTALGHDQRGLEIASAVIGAAVPAAMLPLLRRAGVPFALFFALATMFASEAAPFRYIGLRAQTLALVFMVAALFAMAWRKPAWLGVIAFLFTEAYHGAVILGLFLVATLAVQWLYERRLDLRLVTATAVGVFAGLVLSPWFPANVGYLIFHTVFKTGVDDPFLVGTEWLRPALSFFLGKAIVAHAVLASGLAAIAITRPAHARPRIAQDTFVACILAAVFGAMTATSWRFVEYYGPFAVIASGLLWRDALRQRADSPRLRWAPLAVTLLALAWGIPRGAAAMQEGPSERFDAFADFMRYVDAHDADPMVFNTRWSDFQHMVFWSRRARYVAGLDGNYLRFGDAARWGLWYAFATGARLDRHDNAQAIARTFGARWIVVSATQPGLADNLARDAGAELAMARPGSGWLFEIKIGPRPAPG